MRSIVLFIFLNLVGYQLVAQVDSLFKLYLLEKDDLNAKMLMQRIQSFCKKDISCYKPLLTETKQLPYSETSSRLYSHFCSALYSSYYFEESKNLGLRGIKLIEKVDPYNRWLAGIYNTLALCCGNLSKTDSALIFADKCEKLQNKVGEVQNFWKPDYTRFNAYNGVQNTKLALEYLKKSYSYLKNSQDRMNKGFLLFELLNLTNKAGFEKDFDHYLEEYIHFNKEGNKSMDAIHSNLSAIFKDDKNSIAILERKLKLLEKNDTIQTNKGVITDHITDKMKLVDLYGKYGENQKAIDQLKIILVDTATSDMVIKSTLSNLASNYYDLKQLDSAYKYSMLLNEEVIKSFNKNLDQSIAEYEVKYQTQQKDVEISKQKTIVAEENLKFRTSLGLIIGLGLLTILSLIYYRNKIKNQKLIMAKEQELQAQKIKQLEHENKVLALNSMIEGQESERLRIAQDLHDGLGGLLTTVKAHFSAIEREINAVKNLNIYDKTNNLIDKACIEVRRIAHDMVPHSIQISGLQGALQDLKQSILARGLDCELELHQIETLSISQEKASMIYRIIQEITTNAVKHADASKLLIQLMGHDQNLHILIEDNGKGFDINQVLSKKGMGLKSIDSRVKYLNGNINFDSTPSLGTTVNIEIPF